MASLDTGKTQVVAWIREHFSPDACVLDVGACDGKWRNLLPEYTMDAIEVFLPNIENNHLREKYRTVFHEDARKFRQYDLYDLVIFGDVLEHMTTEEAQSILERTGNCVVALPFLYKQDAIYGNPYEKHIQDDLTAEIVKKRYPQLKTIYDTGNYAYYFKGDLNR